MVKSWYSIDRALKSAILVSFLAVLSLSGVQADEYRAWPGEFMRMGTGARALGMGNAYTGINGDIYSSYFNPAGLADMNGKSFALSMRYLTMDRHFRHFVYGSRIGPGADFAISWINAGTGDVEGRDLNGNPTGNLRDSRNSFALTFSRRMNPWLAFGMNAKMAIWKLADDDARAFGLDLGLMATPLENLAVGVNVRDISSAFTWKSDRWQSRISGSDGQTIEAEDKFPLYVTAGASYRTFGDKILLALAVEHMEDNPLAINAGGEYEYSSMLSLRAGYYHYTTSSEIETGSVTAGFTLNITRSTGIEYAYATDGIESDSIHTVSLVMEYED